MSASDSDSPVRVVVTPSQSSYFAGEPFTVTITFTNTRSPSEPIASPSPRSQGHKRGAHSISSAPLARPPTSPGPLRTAAAAIPARSSSSLVKKGLIGKDIAIASGSKGNIPQLIEQRRKRLLAKSLSVSISPQELDGILAEGGKPGSPLRNSYLEDEQPAAPSSKASPVGPSPLTRSPALPLASNHPHARKHSVLDGQQAEIHELRSPPTSKPPPSAPYTPNSSTSSFSLALDPISESSSSTSQFPQTPTLSLPSIETPTTGTFSNSTNPLAFSYPISPPSQRQPPHLSQRSIGLGQPSKQSNSHVNDSKLQLPRTAFTSTFPRSQLPKNNSELILYSYAQIVGKLTIDTTNNAGTSVDILKTPEQAHALHILRSSLIGRKAKVGGGSMDITSSLLSPPPTANSARRSHGRSTSFSAGLMSLLSPSSLAPSTSSPGLAASASWGGSRSRAYSGSVSPSGSSFFGPREEEVDPDAPLPTFEVQPAMLAVDMSLAPGESKSYTYSVPLPKVLPPTFRGRVFKFSYELVVGTCRANNAQTAVPSASAGSNSISRVMKVPIRVYNNVEVGRTPTPYDLMWPLNKVSSVSGKVVEQTNVLRPVRGDTASSSHTAQEGSIEDLRAYAAGLLDDNRRMRHQSGEDDDERQYSNWIAEGPIQDGGLTGCREAVELVTRTPKKASFDVNKDGVKVAVLSFTKSAYRLGETVLGVIEVNERLNKSRVLQLSVMLESQEIVPSTIGKPSNPRNLRRIHAEHHSLFALSTLRTTFSLDIPSDASPAFQIRHDSYEFPKTPNPGSPLPVQTMSSASGGLEWKVRLCLSVAVTSDSTHAGSEGVRFKALVRDGTRGEWGSSWRATSALGPMEKKVETGEVDHASEAQPQQRSWTSTFVSLLGGGGESLFHDGDTDAEEDTEEAGAYDGIKANSGGGVGVGINYGGGQPGWSLLKSETVECEVPIKVWPGNTVFKAVDVVFDV